MKTCIVIFWIVTAALLATTCERRVHVGECATRVDLLTLALGTSLDTLEGSLAAMDRARDSLGGRIAALRDSMVVLNRRKQEKEWAAFMAARAAAEAADSLQGEMPGAAPKDGPRGTETFPGNGRDTLLAP